MKNTGPEFYDNEENFKSYLQRREWNENVNDTIEKPIISQLIGNVSDKNVLDLGCGNAAIAMELLDKGCKSYIGIDGSRNMVKLAQDNLDKIGGDVIHANIEEWDFPENKFNLVLSRLAIHYIEDIDSLFEKVYKSLRQNGHFVFSVEHPVITSSCDMEIQSGQKTSWVVDNYFNSGQRVPVFLGGEVIKYHRTIEEYFTKLGNAKFVIEQLRESKPKRDNFINQDTFERRLKIPLLLFFSAKKTTP